MNINKKISDARLLVLSLAGALALSVIFNLPYVAQAATDFKQLVIDQITQGSLVIGDLFYYGGSSDTQARLPSGSDGKILTTHGAGHPPTWETNSGSVDTTAIHKATSSEIYGLALKTTPVDADVILGEDSANSYSKVKILKSALGSSAPVISNKTDDFNITSSDDNTIFTNFGAAKDIKGTMVGNLSEGFTCTLVNQVGIPSTLKSLLHFNTSATADSSGMTWTNTTGTIDTGVKKFGAGSLSLTVSGAGYVYTPVSNLPFSTSNFCIQWWMQRKTGGTCYYCMGLMTSGGTEKMVIRHEAGGMLRIQTATTTSSADGIWTDDTTFHHFALVRNGTNLILYYDGTAVATQSFGSGAIDTSGCTNFSMGRGGDYSGDAGTDAYIDELQIDIGTPVYTGNFTPPTSALVTARLSLAPPAGGRLAGTSAINRLQVSSTLNDLIKYRVVNQMYEVESVFPAIANWVDTAP